MVKNWNDSEDQLVLIESRLDRLDGMDEQSVLELNQKLDELAEEFYDSLRLNRIRKELFLKKMTFLKDSWNQQSQQENIFEYGAVKKTISLRGVKDRLNEGQALYKIFQEDKINQEIVFLNELVKAAEERMRLKIRPIKSVEQLELIEQDPEQRIINGVIVITEDIIEHKMLF